MHPSTYPTVRSPVHRVSRACLAVAASVALAAPVWAAGAATAQAPADAQPRQLFQPAMQLAGAGDAAKAAVRGDGGTPQQREEQQAVEAWMRRVPDDPGALLRAKFQLENERRKREGR